MALTSTPITKLEEYRHHVPMTIGYSMPLTAHKMQRNHDIYSLVLVEPLLLQLVSCVFLLIKDLGLLNLLYGVLIRSRIDMYRNDSVQVAWPTLTIYSGNCINIQVDGCILRYATSLIYYRDSRMNLYQNLKDQLTGLHTFNTNFNNRIATFTTAVNTFNVDSRTLSTLVTSQINGIDYSSNCTVIANSMRFFYNTFCVNFIHRSVQFGTLVFS